MSYGNTMDTGDLWWNKIAGPARLIADIESTLSEGRSVVCNVTTSLSFRWTFRDSLGHWLSERNVAVEHIDCNGIYKGEDITEFLLRHLQPSILIDYQRRRTPQYLRDKGVLHGKLLWIRGVDPQYLREWIQYISSYRSHDLDHGLFFLEVQANPTGRIPQNVRFFDHDRYIRKDDLRLYVAILAESYMDAPTGVKQYAAELVAALSVMDGELANDMLLQPELITADPVEILQQIVADSYSDSPRGQEAWHPFALLHKNRISELEYRVWSAQVRVGYPQIEMERLELINNFYQEIQNALTIPFLDDRTGESRRFTDYEGNPITDPQDMEVGMLLKLSMVRSFEDPTYRIFYIPEQEKRLRLLRDCRNRLAHLEVCKPEIFYKLVSST